MATLKARNLSKAYKGRRVVNGKSHYFNGSEVVGLLGPNGAGKTTCFYMIVGLIGCDQGSIYLEKTDITRSPMHRRARMGLGYLPQEPSVFRKLTVRENILAILETRQDLSKAEREEQLHYLLQELHIVHLKDATALSLSGGERRRVEIARALAAEPRFVLLDEPFAGVDPISVGDIQELIAHLRDLGIGILITDHSVRETLGICERAYIMNEGQVIAEGDPEHILEHQHVRDVYLGQDFQL